MTWFKQIFTAASGQMSSKRVCGVIGFITCLSILVYCTYYNQEAPKITDTVLFVCCGLLGVDSITSIWKQ